MTTLRSRPYAHPADLPRLQALWPACRPAAWLTDFPSPTDLAEVLAAPESAARTQIWEDADGRVRAYALVDDYGNLWFDRVLEVAGDEADGLVAWGMACARNLCAQSGQPASLDTACRAEDDERIALLRRHGFTELAVRTLRFVRPLAEPIPEPTLPAGYTIRPVAGETEVEALVALHRAAFGTEHMTAAERLTWMRAPDYDPALDLVAVAPDGSLAAYCFCAIRREENRLSGRNDGDTDPLATHPAHQGRGLARALLCAGMARLRARGAERSLLGTSSDNRPMQAAAQAVGYRIESERIWFQWRAPTQTNARRVQESSM
jgi:ribosomal protein S18 acetylase RimI-like enzyme